MRLYLTEFGTFLGRRRNRFVVRRRCGEAREFVSDEVEEVVIQGVGISFSVNAIRLALEKKIPVILSYADGTPYGLIFPMTASGTIAARRGQLLAYNDRRGLSLAKAFAQAKLMNQSNLLKLLSKSRRRRDRALANELYNAAREIDSMCNELADIDADNVDEARPQIMAKEAEAAKLYWNAVSLLLPTEFDFPGREKRGARDPVNVLLNYGYGCLLSEVWKAVFYAGLDPYAGYLHADRPGKPSLVLDLMEEFRQPVVDRTVFFILAKRMLKADEMLEDEPGLDVRLLTRHARGIFLKCLTERLESKVHFNGRKIPLKNIILHQARDVARFVKGEVKSYIPFTQRW